MTKQSLTFYVLDENTIRKRFKRILQGRPLETLECQICRRSFKLGDQIVRRRRKLYHLSCFNNSIFDISDDILTPEEEYLVENGFYPDEQMNSITLSSISISIQMNNF